MASQLPPKKKLSFWEQVKIYTGGLIRTQIEHAEGATAVPIRRSRITAPPLEGGFPAWIRIEDVFFGGPKPKIQEAVFAYVAATRVRKASIVNASDPVLHTWVLHVLSDAREHEKVTQDLGRKAGLSLSLSAPQDKKSVRSKKSTKK
jgi:hypothetical protein